MASQAAGQTSSRWIADTSCSANAAAIANAAISHVVNLEFAAAVGAADSALLIDPECGAAKLVRALVANNNAEWGSKQKWIATARSGKLSKSEQAMANAAEATPNVSAVAARTVAAGNTSPLFAYWAAYADQANTADQLEQFATAHANHPTIAAPAYNSLAYAYAQATWGVKTVDMAKAKAYIDKLIKAYPGMNSYDSQAEIFAMTGDYASALAAQQRAVDIAGDQADYGQRGSVYNRKVNAEQLKSTIAEYVKMMQASPTNDKVNITRMARTMVACDSNMSPCYTMDPAGIIAQNAKVTWTSEVEATDIVVTLNDDATVAIATFMNTGTYMMNGTSTAYRTRASSVWTREADGSWKQLHGNFAPAGGAGIPKRNH